MSTKMQHYNEARRCAQETRSRKQIDGFKVGIRDIQRIYREENITYDLVPNSRCPFEFKKIQGMYVADEDGTTIVINKRLPKDPRVFTMAHELKHHYMDSDKGEIICYNENSSMIEIGANVFAAEFVLPDALFKEGLCCVGCNRVCKPEHLIRLKIGSGTSLSYEGLVKKAVWLDLGIEEDLKKVKYFNLAKKLFGGYADPRRIELRDNFRNMLN